MFIRPGSFLALVSAGIACWLERQAAARIEYLKAENRALRIRLGRRRMIFTGYTRIQGRRISWSAFLKAHWRALAASDFFTVEVWGLKGLLTFYVLFVIDLSTRRVTVCGMTTNPNDVWMLQISRNLIDVESGALRDKRLLIIDRDTKYSSSFRQALEREGVGVIRLPPRSPNLNAYAERFVRSVKEECLSKIIPIGPSLVRRVLLYYVDGYHRERNHQGLGNRTITP